MGYRDVTDYHGGPLEQGKDIVMWKPGEMRERLDYAVVVKKKVNGRASGTGSAGEVLTQIEQCFATPYNDPQTGEKRRIERCLVMIANRIPKEFTNATYRILEKNGLSRVTEFINLDQIWEWIEKHQPERTIFSSIQQLQTLISQKFPGLGAEIHVSKEKTLFNLKPIEPDLTMPPQSIVFHITSEGEAGRRAREEYERSVKTGAGFTISKDQVKGAEIPEILKEMYGIADGSASTFTFTPVPSNPVLWHFKRVCDSGYFAILQNIELKTVQAGTEEATLNNEHQGIPWTFTVVTRKEPKGLSIQFSFRTNLSKANVRQALDWFRFQYGLSHPGHLVLEHAETGIEFSSSSDPGTLNPPDETVMTLLEKLVYIQSKTMIAIPHFARLTREDAENVEQLYEIVKTGRLPLDSFTGGFQRDRLLANANVFRAPGALNIEFSEDSQRTCLGVDFNLGPSRIVGYNIVLDKKSADHLKSELEKPTEGDSIELTLQPIESGSLEVVYPNWMSSPA